VGCRYERTLMIDPGNETTVNGIHLITVGGLIVAHSGARFICCVRGSQPQAQPAPLLSTPPRSSTIRAAPPAKTLWVANRSSIRGDLGIFVDQSVKPVVASEAVAG